MVDFVQGDVIRSLRTETRVYTAGYLHLCTLAQTLCPCTPWHWYPHFSVFPFSCL